MTFLTNLLKDKSKLIKLVAGAALLIVAGVVAVLSMRNPPAPPSEAQQAEAAVAQGLQQAEAQAREQQRTRQLKVQGADAAITEEQEATNPGGGRISAPK